MGARWGEGRQGGGDFWCPLRKRPLKGAGGENDALRRNKNLRASKDGVQGPRLFGTGGLRMRGLVFKKGNKGGVIGSQGKRVGGIEIRRWPSAPNIEIQKKKTSRRGCRGQTCEKKTGKIRPSNKSIKVAEAGGQGGCHDLRGDGRTAVRSDRLAGKGNLALKKNSAKRPWGEGPCAVDGKKETNMRSRPKCSVRSEPALPKSKGEGGAPARTCHRRARKRGRGGGRRSPAGEPR